MSTVLEGSKAGRRQEGGTDDGAENARPIREKDGGRTVSGIMESGREDDTASWSDAVKRGRLSVTVRGMFATVGVLLTPERNFIYHLP